MARERIGIAGGMGPLAGVHLQRLIIDATPAKKDQDHLEVVCYTNPMVPDRTASLKEDEGRFFVRGIKETLEVLRAARATLGVIPCITSHARFLEISRISPLPLLNVVELTEKKTADMLGRNARVLVLATDGTVSEKVFERGKSMYCVYLSREKQRELMDIIYEIKRENNVSRGEERLAALLDSEALKSIDAVIFGCTELSLCFDRVSKDVDVPAFDPLRIAAEEIVKRCS